MYRAFNAVFGKVGRTASPGVVVELVKTKCLPVSSYGIEVCPVNKSHIGSRGSMLMVKLLGPPFIASLTVAAANFLH